MEEVTARLTVRRSRKANQSKMGEAKILAILPTYSVYKLLTSTMENCEGVAENTIDPQWAQNRGDQVIAGSNLLYEPCRTITLNPVFNPQSMMPLTRRKSGASFQHQSSQIHLPKGAIS
jgi:hypothetical protein